MGLTRNRKNERKVYAVLKRAKACDKLGNEDIGLLRQIANDSNALPSRRLRAIDRLACLGGVYNTTKCHVDSFIPMGTRPRREVVAALRKLLRDEPALASGIRERLLFIRTGQSLNLKLWRVEPKVKPESISPVDLDVASKLKQIEDEFYAARGGESPMEETNV